MKQTRTFPVLWQLQKFHRTVRTIQAHRKKKRKEKKVIPNHIWLQSKWESECSMTLKVRNPLLDQVSTDEQKQGVAIV